MFSAGVGAGSVLDGVGAGGSGVGDTEGCDTTGTDTVVAEAVMGVGETAEGRGAGTGAGTGVTGAAAGTGGSQVGAGGSGVASGRLVGACCGVEVGRGVGLTLAWWLTLTVDFTSSSSGIGVVADSTTGVETGFFNSTGRLPDCTAPAGGPGCPGRGCWGLVAASLGARAGGGRAAAGGGGLGAVATCWGAATGAGTGTGSATGAVTWGGGSIGGAEMSVGGCGKGTFGGGGTLTVGMPIWWYSYSGDTGWYM